MTALGYALGLAAVLAACWFLGWLEERRQLWVLPPHSYRCHDCRTGYSDVRALTWHRQSTHVDTYDSDRAPNAAHRRDDAGRNSAGEILGGGPAALPGSSGEDVLKQRTRDHLFSTGES